MRKDQPIRSWAEAEVAGADSGDARIDKRLAIVLSALGQAPGKSIAQSCNGGRAEIAGAYRFFDHAAATPATILEPHRKQTLRRMAEHATVLVVQDTTQIDMTQPQRQVKNAGPLDGPSRQGALLHLMAAFSPQGVPLGSVWSKIIVREAEGPRRRTREQLRNTPMEQKESVRWLEGLKQAHLLARAQPEQQIICVADSEADIFEYLTLGQEGVAEQSDQQVEAGQHQPMAPSADWIVRACQDRKTKPEQQQEEPIRRSLREACQVAPVLFAQTVQVRGRPAPLVASDSRQRRQPREDRVARVEVRALTVTLQAPQRKGGRQPELSVNAVLVSEVDPPAGEVAVEWLLLSSLPIQSEEQVRQIVASYAKRFMIEVFFRVLKSGCRIEARRFETCARHLSFMAVSLIVAWRVLWLSQLGQHAAQEPASVIFEACEWQAAWAVVYRGKPLPDQPPNMEEMIKLIGRLGGWIERSGKYASPPGAQVLWQGLARLNDLAFAWSDNSKTYV